MNNSKTLESDNLVLFPSAKNYVKDADCCELDDPMMEILNEFSHLSDEHIPDYLDNRFENEWEYQKNTEQVYDSLEAYMNRPKNKVVASDKMSEILELKAKIKFYLDEIDMFLPRRR